ncbi:hypothetical protein OIU35_33350 [Boseaceae bacterium BT-24-1]|nr:hypothetical protein [Boseaceae bacterium BT-24-1]
MAALANTPLDDWSAYYLGFDGLSLGISAGPHGFALNSPKGKLCGLLFLRVLGVSIDLAKIPKLVKRAASVIDNNINRSYSGESEGFFPLRIKRPFSLNDVNGCRGTLSIVGFGPSANGIKGLQCKCISPGSEVLFSTKGLGIPIREHSTIPSVEAAAGFWVLQDLKL